ncbi:MAG: hypothetical protein ACREQY_19195 [Candidatus Binatia bacterium]
MNTDSPAPASRAWWMTACAFVCLAYFVAFVGLDLFHPKFRAVEVWFGFEVGGRLARLTAPLHWSIFAFGAFAFWRGHAWIVPWAAGYVFYAAISHLVWSEMSPNGRGWPIGLLQAVAISSIGVALLRARSRLPGPRTFV